MPPPGDASLPPDGARPQRGSGAVPAALAGIAGATMLAGDTEAQEGEQGDPEALSQALEQATADVERLESELATFDALDENDAESVRAIQRILVRRGFPVGGPDLGRPDGRYGDATFRAMGAAREQIAAELDGAEGNPGARARLQSLQEQAAAPPDNPILTIGRSVAPWAAAGVGLLAGHGARGAVVRDAVRGVERRNEAVNRLLPLDDVGGVIPVDRGTSIDARRSRSDLAGNLNEFWFQGGAGERVPFRETDAGWRPRRGAAEPTTLYPDPAEFAGLRPLDGIVLGSATAESAFAYTQYEKATDEVEAAREALAAPGGRTNPENHRRLERALNDQALWESAMRLGQGTFVGHLGGMARHQYPRNVRPNVPAASAARADLNDYIRVTRGAERRRRP